MEQERKNMRAKANRWGHNFNNQELGQRIEGVEPYDDQPELRPVEGNTPKQTQLLRRIGAIQNSPRNQDDYWADIQAKQQAQEARINSIHDAISARRKSGNLWGITDEEARGGAK